MTYDKRYARQTDKKLRDQVKQEMGNLYALVELFKLKVIKSPFDTYSASIKVQGANGKTVTIYASCKNFITDGIISGVTLIPEQDGLYLIDI